MAQNDVAGRGKGNLVPVTFYMNRAHIEQLLKTGGTRKQPTLAVEPPTEQRETRGRPRMTRPKDAEKFGVRVRDAIMRAKLTDNLKMASRLGNSLERAGAKSFEDIVAIDSDDLQNVESVGASQALLLRRLQKAIVTRPQKFGMEESPRPPRGSKAR